MTPPRFIRQFSKIVGLTPKRLPACSGFTACSTSPVKGGGSTGRGWQSIVGISIKRT